MTFTLGREPEKFKLVLVDDADFITSLLRTDGDDWPVGLEATIEVLTSPPTEWDGELDGEYIRWNVDVAEVQPVYDARPKKAKLWYVDGGVRILWATGTVERL